MAKNLVIPAVLGSEASRRPRETDISNPTDETLTSADPDTPVCDDGDTTDASDPSDESDSTDPSDEDSSGEKRYHRWKRHSRH